MQHSTSALASTKFDTNSPSRNTSTYAITTQPRENSKHQTIIYYLYFLKNLAPGWTPLHALENA